MLLITPMSFTQKKKNNPYLTPEQQQQVEEYRKVLIEQYVKPIEKEIEMENFTIDSIKGLIDWLDRFANHSKKAYSVIDSPFNLMTATSSNEKCFTATAGKKAVPDTHQIEILQIASADVLVSEPVSVDTKFDSAEFTIASGEAERTIKFKSGNIKALERDLNKYGEKVVKARTIRKDEKNYILLLEGLITGERNKLIFFGDLTPLQQIGMLYGKPDTKINIGDTSKTDNIEETPVEEQKPNLITQKSTFQIVKGTYSKETDDIVIVNPKSQIEMILPNKYTIIPESYLEVQVMSTPFKKEEKDKPSTSLVGAGDTQDLEVDNVGVIEEPYNDPFLPVTETDVKKDVASFIGAKSTKDKLEQKLATEDKPVDENWTTVKIQLNQYFKDGVVIDKVVFINDLSDKNLKYTKLNIYSEYKEEKPENADEVQPDGNYQKRSKDAIIKYEGIELTRESNLVKDLINDVEITLKKETDKKEELKIDHNYEEVVKYIKDFIDYNNLLSTYVYNVTQFDKDKTAEDLLKIYRGEGLDKKEYEEAKLYGEAYERLLYGDRDVEKVKMELRKIMKGAYDTQRGYDLSLLVQMGIKDKDYDYKLQNPLLEVDEDEFNEVLKENFDAVKEFFFKDTNEDAVVDNGLTVVVFNFVDVYRQRRIVPKEGVVYPGIFYGKIEIHRKRLEQLKKDLEKAKQKVEDEVNKFIQELIKMNQAKEDQNGLGDMLGGGNND